MGLLQRTVADFCRKEICRELQFLGTSAHRGKAYLEKV